jgi:2-C-methyl-D-erythritol 4-phosphate cytidylyltransferase
MNIAIILAGGSGKRMGAGKNKVFLEMGKKPVIFYTLENFEKSKHIGGIVLVAPKNEKKLFKEIIKKNKFKKILGIALGGKERQDSGHNGIKFVDKKIKNKEDVILLFHNGANPFVSQEEIENSIQTAEKRGACVVAHKTKDTIRKVNVKGISLGVIDRANLWNMQTPQTIKFSLAKKAFEKAEADNFLGTDDVSLIERLGKKIEVIPASENNFKITTPLDLALAKIILKNNKYA